MAFTEALRILIDADTRGAVRSIEQLGAATDKSLGKSQKTIDKWSRGLTVAGAGMVALGGAALFGLGKAAMASEEAEQGFRKLQNSIANNPRLAAESANAFRDLAESIQDKTAADADSIVAGQAVLAQRKLDAAQIKALTPLVVDLARKKGIDEVAAFTLASKAVDGNAGALKRAGISIDEAAFKSDAFGATVDALRSSVGGYAEEEGATFAGSLERLKNQMGDLVEGVGAGAVDAFSDLFGVIGGGVEKLNDLSPAAQNVIGKVATFGSVALVAAGGLSFLVGQALTARSRFKELGEVLGGLRSKLAGISGAAGLAGLAAGLVAAGAGIALYLREQNEEKILAGAEAFAKLRDVSREAAAETLRLNDAVRVSTTDFTAGASVQEEFARTGEITSDVMRDLNKHWDEVISKSPQFAQAFIDNAEQIGVSKDKLAEWQGELDNKIQTDGEAIASQEEYNAQVDEAAGVTEEATSALQEYSDTLRAMIDPLFGAMDAITGVRDAQLAEKDAAVAVVEAQAALNEARAAGDPAAIAEAERGLADAQRDLSDAQWATVESAAQADAALAGLQDAVDRGDVSVDTFKDTLRQWVEQGFLTQGQADAAAKSVGGLASQAEDADSKRVDIPVTTPGSVASTGQLGRVKDAAFQIPTKRSTTVSAKDNASNILRDIQRLLGGITSKTVTVTTQHKTLLSTAVTPENRRQHGGPVRKGQAYLVGEGGVPEVFVPDRNGMILPSVHHLGHMGGGGGGGAATVVNFNMTFNGPTNSTQVIEAIKSYERTNGAGWRS